jgi:hypothetical protein
MPPQAKALKENIRNTLTSIGIDHQNIIDEFGQVRAVEHREDGGTFSFRDHLKGLVLSLLSSQRPWGPIAANLSRINEIFFNFESENVCRENPQYFVIRLQEIRCGNRRIVRQMESLAPNIGTLKRISQEFGSLDDFVNSDSPYYIAKKLSGFGRYKLNEIGFTLALEYLRNVGIRASKPDLHVRRLLSNERLGYFSRVPSEKEAYEKVGALAGEANCCPTYLDNLLWLFCARDYGNICGAQPHCNICRLFHFCNYQR